MIPDHGPGRWWHGIVVADFYLASVLLLVAGVLKFRQPGVSELLQSLWEQGLFSLETMLAVTRWQPWLETTLALAALVGWRAEWWARGFALLYLFFAGLIVIAAQGYWAEPLDCGCFGSGDGFPVYLLVGRNLLIGVPLFWAGPFLRRWTVFYRGDRQSS